MYLLIVPTLESYNMHLNKTIQLVNKISARTVSTPPQLLSTSSSSISLLHFFTLPSSSPILASLISHPFSMPAVVLKAVSGRSAGQDLGKTSAVLSLDKCEHCKGTGKCVRPFTTSHFYYMLIIDTFALL